MVHNGIEYADMQLIGEAYDLTCCGGSRIPLHRRDRRRSSARWKHRRPQITGDHRRGAGAVDAGPGKPLGGTLIVDEAGQRGTGPAGPSKSASTSASLPPASPGWSSPGAVELHRPAQGCRWSVGEHPRRARPPTGTPSSDDIHAALCASKVVAYA